MKLPMCACRPLSPMVALHLLRPFQETPLYLDVPLLRGREFAMFWESVVGRKLAR